MRQSFSFTAVASATDAAAGAPATSDADDSQPGAALGKFAAWKLKSEAREHKKKAAVTDEHDTECQQEKMIVVEGKSAVVRSSAARSSSKVGTLPSGTECAVLQRQTVDGQSRVKIRALVGSKKITGWTSCVSAKDGSTLLSAL
jgi:hypothetical protein